MAYIQDITVNILNGTTAVTQKGFGIPLILGAPSGTKTGFTDRYREVTSTDELAGLYGKTTNEYKMVSVMFSQEPRPEKVVLFARAAAAGAGTAEQTIKEALDEVNSQKPGFYAIFIPERDQVSIKHAGDWADANEKIFFACLEYEDSTAFNAKAAGMNYARTAVIVYDDNGTTETRVYPECAWAGQNLPKAPGSITWKWKKVGIKDAGYNTTILNEIRSKNMQTVTNVGGVNVVNEGKTTNNEYIDVIRGKDWVKARIEEGLYQLFFSNEKVPMDNVGIAQVEGVIRSVLKNAGNRDIIAKATTEAELRKSDDKEYMYKISVPKREDIQVNDRANRILRDVRFEYYLAGAIHEAKVTGKIIV